VSEPFLAEIRMFSFDFVPNGWHRCDGSLLPINQNQALFSLLGTQYGGNGITTFALPDLRDSAPMHIDSSNGTQVIGEKSGEATHTLTVAELPLHPHAASAQVSGSTGSPTNARWASTTQPAYTAAPNVVMSSSALASSGGSQPHENRPPFLVIVFAIAMSGIFPSRN
jgi:microcystin-dependent protein